MNNNRKLRFFFIAFTQTAFLAIILLPGNEPQFGTGWFLKKQANFIFHKRQR